MEEPGFRVLLTEAGDRKTEAIRAVRTVTGLSLWNSKLLLAGAPVDVPVAGWPEAAVRRPASLRTQAPAPHCSAIAAAAPSGSIPPQLGPIHGTLAS